MVKLPFCPSSTDLPHLFSSPTDRVLWEFWGRPYVVGRLTSAALPPSIDSWPCQLSSPTNIAADCHPVRREFLLEVVVQITAFVGAPPLFLSPRPPPLSFWPPVYSSCHDRPNATNSSHYCLQTRRQCLSHYFRPPPFGANFDPPELQSSTLVPPLRSPSPTLLIGTLVRPDFWDHLHRLADVRA